MSISGVERKGPCANQLETILGKIRRGLMKGSLYRAELDGDFSPQLYSLERVWKEGKKKIGELLLVTSRLRQFTLRFQRLE